MAILELVTAIKAGEIFVSGLGRPPGDDLLDAGDHLGWRIEFGIRDFIEHGAITFMADPSQDGNGEVADVAREVVVVELGEIVDGMGADGYRNRV